jgi:predicted DNA-binding transcriptional regulator YafY
MKSIKEVVVEYIEGLHTEVTFTDDLRDDILSEVENIPSTTDQELRVAVKSIMVEMAMEGKLEGDINDVCFDTVFDKAEEMIQKGNVLTK